MANLGLILLLAFIQLAEMQMQEEEFLRIEQNVRQFPEQFPQLRQTVENNVTYFSANDGQIMFRRDGIESVGKKLVVIRNGQSFVVLRRAAKRLNGSIDENQIGNLYYANLVYIWYMNNSLEPFIEWADFNNATQTKQTCQQSKETCQLPDWIFGTCNCNNEINKVADPQELMRQVLLNISIFNHERLKRNVSSHNSTTAVTKKSTLVHKSKNMSNATLPPTSYDLLLVNQVESTNGTTELIFKNQVEETKKRETIANDFYCKHCNSIGTEFYKEFIIQTVNASFLRQHFVTVQVHEPADLFVGYGDCQITGQQRDKERRRPASIEIDDIVDFYTTILNIDCKLELKNLLRNILTSKYKITVVQKDLAVGLNPTSEFIQLKLLTRDQYNTLFTALVFQQFTTIYIEESTLGTSKSTTMLSKPIKFIYKLTIRILQEIHTNLHHHFIKLTCSVLRLVQGRFYTVLIQRFSYMKKRLLDKDVFLKMNLNELWLLIGLAEFIIYGQGPNLKSGPGNLQQSFRSFYKLNQLRIRNIVEGYL